MWYDIIPIARSIVGGFRPLQYMFKKYKSRSQGRGRFLLVSERFESFIITRSLFHERLAEKPLVVKCWGVIVTITTARLLKAFAQ